VRRGRRAGSPKSWQELLATSYLFGERSTTSNPQHRVARAMRLSLEVRHCAVLLLQLSVSLVTAASSNATVRLLPDSFTPPSLFENTNLVRNVNLDRSYPRETTNIVIKNVGKQPQSQYYFQFPTDLVPNVAGLAVKNKNNADATYKVELAQHESPK
jgi:oligosaccharyltransferase complex subunit alpha (ribophorin I)